MPKKSDYWIGNFHRSEQIYNWFNDVVVANNLTFFYQDIRDLLLNNKFNDAVDRFKELVFSIASGEHFGENGDTLGYLIGLNQNKFGTNRVILDLFNGTVRVKFKIRRRAKETPKPIRETTIKQVTKEVEKKAIQRFGINVKGKKEKVTIRVRRNNTLYLQSKRTGKFLKWTKEFKKEVERRRRKKEK